MPKKKTKKKVVKKSTVSRTLAADTSELLATENSTAKAGLTAKQEVTPQVDSPHDFWKRWYEVEVFDVKISCIFFTSLFWIVVLYVLAKYHG